MKINTLETQNMLSRFGELDYPVMRDTSGNFITARQVIDKNIPFTVSLTPDWELLKTRFTMRYNDGKLETVGILDGSGMWTPEQQIAEVNTVPLSYYGQKFLEVENATLKYLKYG